MDHDDEDREPMKTKTKKKSDKKKTVPKRHGPKVKLVGKETALRAFEKLAAHYPDAHCELDHHNAFELLVSTVLSAQTTDVNVNKAAPKIFAKYPDARALAKAEPEDLEPLTSTLGFFRQKAKSIVMLARSIVETHGGEVPSTMAELVKLRGVGRKTANVVLGVAFKTPEGVVVDTHVQRLSQRLGWTRHKEPLDIEQDLMNLLPRKDWDTASHVLIWHGRRCCTAMKPNCKECPVNAECPSAFKAEKVGRKPKRVRPKPKARARA
jgi:endonuclease-3